MIFSGLDFASPDFNGSGILQLPFFTAGFCCIRFLKILYYTVRDDMNPVPGHPNHNPDGILRGMGVSFVLDSVGNGGFPFLGFRTEL